MVRRVPEAPGARRPQADRPFALRGRTGRLACSPARQCVAIRRQSSLARRQSRLARRRSRLAQFRRSRPKIGASRGQLPPVLASLRSATGTSLVGTHAYGRPRAARSGLGGVIGSAPEAARIGAEMFETERRNHSRTRVYGEECTRFPVDRSGLADRLLKVKKSLKFRRFDVSLHATGAVPGRPAIRAGSLLSGLGLAKRRGGERRLRWIEGSSYPPDAPNETRWSSRLPENAPEPVAGADQAHVVCRTNGEHAVRGTRRVDLRRHTACTTPSKRDRKTLRLRKNLRDDVGTRRRRNERT